MNSKPTSYLLQRLCILRGVDVAVLVSMKKADKFRPRFSYFAGADPEFVPRTRDLMRRLRVVLTWQKEKALLLQQIDSLRQELAKAKELNRTLLENA